MKTPRASRRWFVWIALFSAMALSANAAIPARPTLALMNADGTEVLDVDQPQVLGWGLNFSDGSGSLYSSGGSSSPRHARDVLAVSSGHYHTLALQRNGCVVAWGWNTQRQRDVPLGLKNVVAIAAGGEHSMALRGDGTVVMWGERWMSWTNVPEGLNDVVGIATGKEHVLALKRDGTVIAWGTNEYGQTTVPAGLTDVAMIAAGSHHSMALKADGTIIAWGRGGGTVAAKQSNVVSIAAGGNYSGAIMRDGKAVSWSAFNSRVVSAGNAVAAGAYFTLALKQDGAVVAWGLNNFGQCKVPAGLKNVVSLAAGRYHTLALKDDGTVVAWGENGAHQCDVPQGLSGVISVSAVDQRSVAVKSDGTIVQWGVRHLLDSSGIWPEVVPTTGVIAAVPGYGRLSALTEAPGDFGSRAVKIETRRHDLLLNSVSTTPLTGVHMVINGPDADQFEVVGNVNDVIPAWTQKALSIVFKPQRLGLAQATMTISSNDPDGPLIIPLKGTGVLKVRATPKASTPAAFTYEPMRVDRQTGLVLQRVIFMNQTGSIVPGLKFSISRLAPGVTVYSSSVGKIVGSIEVLYTNAIFINEVISFDLVYSDPKQRTSSTIQPIIVAENLREAEPRPGPVTGVVVPVLSVRDSVQGPLLEWNAVRGLTYVVEYSDNGGASWSSAVHRLVGGNRILWVDRGQPETVVTPVRKAARAYRVKRLGS